MDTQQGAARDVGQLIDSTDWRGYQIWILALASVTLTLDGLANQALGLALPATIAAWHLPREAFAPVAAMGLVGVTVGSLVGGLIGDRIGRRNGLIASVLLFGLASLAVIATSTIGELILARFVGGLGVGGAIPNTVTLVSEYMPRRRRSFAVSFAMSFIPVGALCAGLIAIHVLPDYGWRGMFVAAGAPTILLALLCVFMLPESPRMLVRQRRLAELTRDLRRCGFAIPDGTHFSSPTMPTHGKGLGALFAEGLAGSTIGLWLAFFFCLLASYTMFSWVPTLLTSQGFDQGHASVAMTWFNLGGVLGGVVGGWLIGRYGSRGVIASLAVGAAISAVVLGTMPVDPALPFTPLILVMIAEGFFISGLHSGLYSLAAHVYDPIVRATGVGAAASAGRIGAVVSSYTGILTMQLAGRSGYFYVVATAALLSLAFLFTIRRHIQSDRTQSP